MGRKIILSRKGFDSTKKNGVFVNGGMPSAFVEGGEMVSFPIPDKREIQSDFLVRYNGICSSDGVSLDKRINQLRGGSGDAFPHTHCHHDPDLIRDARCCLDGRPRSSLNDWRGIYGQSDSSKSQTHLCNNKVGKEGGGDLFLFFGWFKEVVAGANGEWGYRNGAPDVQAFFGFLQVDRVVEVPVDGNLPNDLACFYDHPHLQPGRLEKRLADKQAGKTPEKDAVYIARKHLDLPGLSRKLPGWGVFHHSSALVLTAGEEKQERVPKPKDFSRTVWDLDKVGGGKIFRNRKITYHSEKAWLSEGGLFQSRPRGQEFVVYDDESEVISKWAAKLICNHYSRS